MTVSRDARPVSVVGGSGFIGTRLCRRLEAAGRPFVIIDKQSSAAFPSLSRLADIRDPNAVRAALLPGSVLVHLAAEHRDDVRPASLYDEVNRQGTMHLCDAARHLGIDTIVFTSTVAVYGFAPIGTGEDGPIAPFNEYGRTKYAAEHILQSWQAEAPERRRLSIVRPTVVFGEQNRGNVYNLLKQIASGAFLMIGPGTNRKSVAYVENVSAYLLNEIDGPSGVRLTNYVDKPDFTMNELVSMVLRVLGRSDRIGPRIPVGIALVLSRFFDAYAALTGARPAISSIRVRKFCADSVYATAAFDDGFVPPVPLTEGLQRTIRHEFLEDHAGEVTFVTE